MARNTLPIIIGAVLFGILAIGLTFYALLGGSSPTPAPTVADQSAQPAGSGSTALVARRPIYPRTVITRDMLEEAEGDAAATPNAITNPYDVVGRLANRTIQAGQIVTSDALTTGIGRVIPANIPIPAGLRGVAIWVDPSQTTAGLVDVGDRVDVILIQNRSDAKLNPTTTTTDVTRGRTIAQDLEVLAVDRSILESRPAATDAAPNAAGGTAPAGGAAPGTPGAAPPPPPPANQPPGTEQRIRVILAASPEIAQLLVTADDKGTLHITLRNPTSRERFVIAENRETAPAGPPAPAAAGAARPAAAASGDSGRAPSRPANTDYNRFDPTFTAGPPLPPPSQNIPPAKVDSTPMPAPGKDVTVIRGTEKTRVIVPR